MKHLAYTYHKLHEQKSILVLCCLAECFTEADTTLKSAGFNPMNLIVRPGFQMFEHQPETLKIRGIAKESVVKTDSGKYILNLKKFYYDKQSCWRELGWVDSLVGVQSIIKRTSPDVLRLKLPDERYVSVKEYLAMCGNSGIRNMPHNEFYLEFFPKFVAGVVDIFGEKL